MIELITGLPGNAKTLHALDLVIARAKAENRTVYHAGLKELQADDPRLLGTTWVQFDPLKWHEEVPSGSIIFIDECQKIFRNRSLGSLPGKHVTELEEHRHKGLDFYMITQHPSLIDPAVRKLTQTHRHMVRIWGMEASTVHKWNGVKENCDKNGSRSDSEKTKWAFNKGLYGVYKSADVHTMKRQIPLRAKLLLLMPLVLIAVGWFVFQKVSKSSPSAAAPAAQAVASPASFVGGPVPVEALEGRAKRIDPIEDARQYVFESTPRVVGLEHTAPKYDEITKPVRAPIPAACMQMKSQRVCKCYTQQGTPMQVNYDTCVQIATNGYFQDFDPEKRGETAVADAAPAVAPAAGQPVHVNHVTVIPYTPEPRRVSSPPPSKS